MKTFLFSPLPVLLITFVINKVEPYLADETYPDLTCHKGYDTEEGKKDAESAMEYCSQIKDKHPKADVCTNRCLLVWIGVLHRKTKVMQSAYEIAIELVRYAFMETREGKKGALELARKIHSECHSTYVKVAGRNKSCKTWSEFYECIDNAWRCPVINATTVS